MSHLVTLCGSLRSRSLNASALNLIVQLIRATTSDTQVSALDPASFPYYHADIDQANNHPHVLASRDLVSRADALVIATPSYNSEMPGLLKNALDWLSRPYGESALTGRLVAMFTVSPGTRGGIDAQPGLRAVLTRSGASVICSGVALGSASSRLGTTIETSDPTAISELKKVAGAVSEALEAPTLQK